MEGDSWTLLATAASRRHHQSTIQSVVDAYLGFKDADAGEEEARTEFVCLFCSEEFDLVGLCCHIDDEHPVEAKNGVCPVCASRVGVDLLNHITMQHGSSVKTHRRRRFGRNSPGVPSTSSLLKKELRDGHFHSHFGGSTYSAPSSVAPDPLLSSFIYSSPPAESSMGVDSRSLEEDSLDYQTVHETIVERPEPSLSAKDQKERSQRSAFVQGLLLSTIFEDSL